ncbi:hypothetical protein MsAc7_12930 [Methanolapillus millepedarum]|uniref:Uncharacterized protein n=1 Tax=Methanolapillus millepedarum TaxID=3028296 RepID=A0AA96V4E4_9EURY|nr:hypothetical protein MsAc7_12930 [Methanosarcinaceae archaeon Ac7]
MTEKKLDKMTLIILVLLLVNLLATAGIAG